MSEEEAKAQGETEFTLSGEEPVAPDLPIHLDPAPPEPVMPMMPEFTAKPKEESQFALDLIMMIIMMMMMMIDDNDDDDDDNDNDDDDD